MATLKVIFILGLLIYPLQSQGQGQTCQTIKDCGDFQVCDNGYCEDKKLFPLTGLEVVGLILIVLVSGTANTGGIGGGTMIIPLLLIFFGFSDNTAIVINYGIRFGGSIGNYANVVRSREPKTGRSLIDYDLGLLCMPLMLFGTTIGVVFARMAAPVVIAFAVIAYIVYVFSKVYSRTKKLYAMETAQIKKRKEKLLLQQERQGRQDQQVAIEASQSSKAFDLAEKDPRVQPLIKEERKLFPVFKYFLLIANLAVIIILTLLQGSPKFHSLIGFPFCKLGYWLLFGGGLVICVIFFLFNQAAVKKRLKLKHECQIPPEEGGYTLTTKLTIEIAIFSIIGGFIAGLLGVGGGILLTPIFLNMKMHPQSVTATSSFFVIQTSFISLFQSALYGKIPFWVQAFFLVVAVAGAGLVSMTLNLLVKKYKRPSIVLITLLGVLTLSFLATPVFEMLTYSNNYSAMLVFNDVC